MGLKDFQQILALFQRWFPKAFWPQYKDESRASSSPVNSSNTTNEGGLHPFFAKKGQAGGTGPTFDPSNVVWPPELSRLGIVIDEFNGTVRGLPLGTKDQRKTWAQQAKNGAPTPTVTTPDDAEDPDQDLFESPGGSPQGSARWSGGNQESEEEEMDPIARPEDLLRYLFDRYSKIFFYNTAREVHVVWDCIGRTPAIKSILRAPVPSKPIAWPENKSTLFTSNKPFENSIHDIFDDKEARVLLFDYLTTSLLERFAAEGYFPKGSRLVLWGGYYKGKECPYPLYIENDPLEGLVGPLALKDANAPQAEADVVIAYIVARNLGKCHQMLLSKDSDFIPIFLTLLNDQYKSDSTNDPKRYKLFISHKILVKSRISAEEHARFLHEQSKRQKSQAAVVPKSTAPPEGDEGEDDELARLLGADDEPELFGLDQALPHPPSTPSPKGGKKRTKPDDDTVEIKAKIREVIDMSELFERLWAYMYALHGKCGKCDPIDAFVAMMFMSGCDYYKNPPFISFRTLCHVYFSLQFHRQYGCLCPYDTESALFRLDLQLFKTLLAKAYKAYRNISSSQLSSDTYEEVSALLRRRKADADKAKAEKMPRSVAMTSQQVNGKAPRRAPDQLPPLNPERYAANLHWVVNYYTRSYRSGWVPTNGLERDPETGLSLHGYTYDLHSKKYEFSTQVIVKDVY